MKDPRRVKIPDEPGMWCPVARYRETGVESAELYVRVKGKNRLYRWRCGDIGRNAWRLKRKGEYWFGPLPFPAGHPSLIDQRVEPPREGEVQ